MSETTTDTRTYEIVRFYENKEKQNRVRQRGLSLEQAKKICADPETSSMTAKAPKGCEGNEKKIKRWHEKQKHWFDGYRIS